MIPSEGTMNNKRLARTAAVIGAYAALLAVSRPWHRRWGATDEEIAQLAGKSLPRGHSQC
jgi:hypothetical protein